MIKAEKLCEGVDPSIRPQVVTLADAVLTLEKKITKHLKEVESMPLSIEVTMGDDRTVERANPALQEFRALVRDYSSSLKSLRDILGERSEGKTESSIDSLRNKFKVG